MALVYISLTAIASVAWRAVAPIASHLVHAGSIVLTLGHSTRPRGSGTVILVYFAKDPHCSRRAGADVVANQINAGTSILTWMGAALVGLPLTVLSLIPWHTVACVSSHIAPAGGAIETGLVLAVVHLTLTVTASVINRALAVVCVPSVHAVTATMTKLICLKTSLHGSHLTGDPWNVTVTSRPSTHTVASEGAIFRPATATVLARV